jgi:hypothetical protein
MNLEGCHENHLISYIFFKKFSCDKKPKNKENIIMDEN